MSRMLLRDKGYSLGLVPLLMISLAACSPTVVRPTVDDLNTVRKLAVILPPEEPFTVIYDRAKATGTPGVLFGLIGAATAAAYNASMDNDKAKALAPHLAGFSCRSVFLESLVKALKESGRFSEVDAFDKGLEEKDFVKYDAVVTLQIKSWGLRLAAPSRGDDLAGFIEMDVKMVQSRDNRTLWDEQDTILGHGRQGFVSYQNDGGVLRSAMKEAAEVAGSRIANRLIYP